MAFKKCKNDGCEIQIEVRNTAEGWRPFEENGNKHNCQFSDYAKKQRAQEKNDHGNELGKVAISPPFNTKVLDQIPFVDHTAKGQSKIKIFVGVDDEDVEILYNGFLKENNGKIKTQGAQFQMCPYMDGLKFAIALYYEETA